MGFVVAVDGPAGSGKGTITKKIAKEMNLTSIDTGAMYRSVTLAMLNENIALDDYEKISKLLDEIKIVKERLAKLQREMAETIDVIMEGRDIGTNVFPNANVKIYLDATPEERARRRYLQNKENGIEMPYEEILESVKNRDFIDSTREIAPLKKADDAIYVDSSNMTIDEVVERIKKIISEKRK